MAKNAFDQYLACYDEVGSWEIADAVKADQPFDYVITIPAYNEPIDFFMRIKKDFLHSKNILFILIINQPDNDGESRHNKSLWESIHQQCEPITASQHFSILGVQSSQIIVVDHFSKERRLPRRQGVGLARKIACDIACHMIQQQKIATMWINTTDADTFLPAHYFSTLTNQHQTTDVAALYSFKHRGEENRLTEATYLYEKAINYYVAGLKRAGSVYAFHTIGSCIAINAKAYCQARGYPKRAGGEDFYLLNKLAKLGTIRHLKQCTLAIAARRSNRVPFGTGPAVEKILAQANKKIGLAHGYEYYNPSVFLALGNILQHAKILFDFKNDLDVWLQALSTDSQQALNSIGVNQFFRHLNRQIKTEKQCQQQWNHWLDAFKTLKLIHALESICPIIYGKIPLMESIDIFVDEQAKKD